MLGQICDGIDFSHALAVMLREEDLPSLNYWVPLILLVMLQKKEEDRLETKNMSMSCFYF